jgi:hypothetical protein
MKPEINGILAIWLIPDKEFFGYCCSKVIMSGEFLVVVQLDQVLRN